MEAGMGGDYMSRRERRAEASAKWVRKHRGLMRIYWRVHRFAYRLSGGRLGKKIGERDILMLTTTGRKSGQARSIAIYYFRDGDNLVVIASNGGEDYDPAWWLNLKSHPEAVVQIGSRKLTVAAEEATGEERERLWNMVKREEPQFRTYEKLSKRQIPVVVLRPVGDRR
jgi:deazaflavin-dependent oxidoreductase (nitroreductase family)